MANPAYTPPGVTITEQSTRQVLPEVASVNNVALIGRALGYTTATDILTLEGGKEVALKTLAATQGTLVEIVSVFNRYNHSEGKKSGKEGEGFGEGAKGWELNGGKTKIKPGAESEIPNKAECLVTYTYVPQNYCNPVQLFNIAEVTQRFGNPFNESGEILSPLSLAAEKAIENGAKSLILQPVFKLTKGTEPEFNPETGNIINGEPVNAKANAETANWAVSFKALNIVPKIGIIVPVIGASQTEVTAGIVRGVFLQAVGFEQNRREEEDEYVFGVFGADFSSGSAYKVSEPAKALEEIRNLAAELRTYGGEEYASHNAFVNTAAFTVPTSQTVGNVTVGGQYMAAAVAGNLAGRPVSSSLTRKGLNGFSSVADFRTTKEKNVDAANGEMVIEQLRGGFIRCRHAITLANNESVSRSEISVVRAKFLVIESVKETLENQIVGQIIANANSPIIVSAAIAGVLAVLQTAGSIVSYSAPQSKIATLEPTTIQSSFSYRPAFTINYIDITFSLDISNQSVQVAQLSA